jgi:hypothetical protein
MANYLNGLQQGLKETVRVVRTGPICIVVQDSHYKELRVDLQRVVIESMTAMGRQLSSRDDFDAPNLRARMNPRAARHLTDRRNSESLLVFR